MKLGFLLLKIWWAVCCQKKRQKRILATLRTKNPRTFDAVDNPYTMDTQEALEQFGLEEKEARVYLALLDLGVDRVQSIAKKAKLKRSTTYVILEQLYGKNYIIKSYKNKRLLYAAERPDVLLRSLKHREEVLAEILPLLTARMASASSSRPRITIHEGVTGVRQVYEDIYQSASVSFLGSIKDMSSEFGDLTKSFIKIIKSKDIFVRDLLANDPRDIDFATAAVGRSYEGRVVPQGIEMHIDCAIYGNHVAILSIKKDLFAVVIQNEEIAKTFISFFEFLWQMSKPIQANVRHKV